MPSSVVDQVFVNYCIIVPPRPIFHSLFYERLNFILIISLLNFIGVHDWVCIEYSSHPFIILSTIVNFRRLISLMNELPLQKLSLQCDQTFFVRFGCKRVLSVVLELNVIRILLQFSSSLPQLLGPQNLSLLLRCDKRVFLQHHLLIYNLAFFSHFNVFGLLSKYLSTLVHLWDRLKCGRWIDRVWALMDQPTREPLYTPFAWISLFHWHNLIWLIFYLIVVLIARTLSSWVCKWHTICST
jgi:hypothetical protein